MAADQDLIDCLDQQNYGTFLTSLTPNAKLSNEKVIQSVAVRGIPENRIKR